jgi:hypothetical protein
MTEPGSSQQEVKLRIRKLYQQTKDTRWKGIASEGACFGLSVWWIIKNAQGADYWKWMETADGAELINLAVEQQVNCSELLDKNRFQAAQDIIKGYAEKNLLIPRTEAVTEGPEFTETGTQKIKPGYYYISLEGLWPGQNKRSAHGIAAHIPADGPCKYFDPNLGEGEVATAAAMSQELNKIVYLYDIKEVKISKVRFVLR